MKALGNEKVAKLDKMLNANIYAFRVKKLLFDKKKISPRGMLLNDDIYNLTIGKKDAKGVILIDSDIMELMNRFSLAEQFVESGDALTGFFIDHSDVLYEAVRPPEEGKEKISEGEYVQVFNKVYDDMSEKFLGVEVSMMLVDDPKLEKLYMKIIAENESKQS